MVLIPSILHDFFPSINPCNSSPTQFNSFFFFPQSSPLQILDHSRSTISKLFQNADIAIKRPDEKEYFNFLQLYPEQSNSRSSSSSSTSPLQIPLGSMISCISMSQSVSELETRSESGIFFTHGMAPLIQYGDNAVVENQHRGSGLDLILESRSESRLGSIFQPTLRAVSGTALGTGIGTQLGSGTGSGTGVTSYDTFRYYDAGSNPAINMQGLKVESDDESGVSFNATSSFLGSPMSDNPSVDCCLVQGFDCSSRASQEETCLNLPASLLESKSFDTAEDNESSDIDMSLSHEPICPSTAYNIPSPLPCPLSQQFPSTPILPDYQMLVSVNSVPLEWDDTAQIFDSNDNSVIKPQPCSHEHLESNSLINAYADQPHRSNSNSANNHDVALSPHLNQFCHSNPNLISSIGINPQTYPSPAINHSSFDQSLYSQESLWICQQISFLEQQLHVHESSRLRHQLRQYQNFHNTYSSHENIYDCHGNPCGQVKNTIAAKRDNIPSQLMANGRPLVPQYMICNPPSVIFQTFHTQHQISNQSLLPSHTHSQSYNNQHIPMQFHSQPHESNSEMRSNHLIYQHHQSTQQQGNSMHGMDQYENHRSGRNLLSRNTLSSSVSISQQGRSQGQDIGVDRIQPLPQNLFVNRGAISADHRNRHSSMPSPQSHDETRNRNSQQNAFSRRHSDTPLSTSHRSQLNHHSNSYGPQHQHQHHYLSSGSSKEILNHQPQHDRRRPYPNQSDLGSTISCPSPIDNRGHSIDNIYPKKMHSSSNPQNPQYLRGIDSCSPNVRPMLINTDIVLKNSIDFNCVQESTDQNSNI